MISRHASSNQRQRIINPTNCIQRRREWKCGREVIKGYRSKSEIPEDPNFTVGGFYVT